MRIANFFRDFPDDKSCRLHFKLQREREGIKCKRCKGTHHYWLDSKSQWQCKSCGFRTTLRSGTFMEHSNLSVHTWYLCMAFMIGTKKGISALEMKRQLGMKRYETVWNLMFKIRDSMGKRERKYKLNGTIAFDEGYFEKMIPHQSSLKRGRGSQRQVNVAVMAEIKPNRHLSGSCHHFKMQVLGNHLKFDVNEVVLDYIHPDSTIFSDKSPSYCDFPKFVQAHISTKSTKHLTKGTLKWVHIAIKNAENTILGIHNMIKGKYLQMYLDEFCYKLNRRYFGNKLFDRLVIAVIKA